MGIELPAELRDVAARAGARWPEADEDAMRAAASAWRAAARSIDALAGSADSAAQSALAAFDGDAAQAARREWNGLVADDGMLPSSARQCRAAADRLEHAAEQIGAAKVQLVRELVNLAKQTDAAEQAAAAGHPQALAALDSALHGVAANVAKVHETLAKAVDLDSGVLVEPTSIRLPSGATSLASSTVDSVGAVAGHLGGGVGSAAKDVAGDVGAAADELTSGAGSVADGDGQASGVADDVGSAAEHVGTSAGEAISRGAAGAWQGDAEHTGPVRVDARGWAPGLADAGTGPIPTVGDHPARPGWMPAGTDPASSTAPHQVRSAWAAAPQPPPPPAAPGFAAPPPAVPGGHFAAPPAHQPPTTAPPVSAARPPMPPAAARGPISFGSQPVPQVRQVPRAPLRPLPAPVAPPPPPQPEPSQRPLRQAGRNPDVVAFVLHQFPIGYLPVAASHASRQLPVPESPDARRPGLRFPPQDHPQSHLVDDSAALERARSTEVYAAARRDREEREEPERLPAELVADHEPFGELSEWEWEHRFVVRDGERSEYAWPPAAEFPEGGVEPAEPVVLAPDAVIDCLGGGDGRVAFAAGTAFAQRSLPPEDRDRAYRRYRVMRPLPVWQSVAAPWFAQPGGGIRYRTTYSLVDLVALGYLVELTRARANAEATTLRLDRSAANPRQQDGVCAPLRAVAPQGIASEGDESDAAARDDSAPEVPQATDGEPTARDSDAAESGRRAGEDSTTVRTTHVTEGGGASARGKPGGAAVETVRITQGDREAGTADAAGAADDEATQEAGN
ncbi:hypothetical protein GCM10011581_12990 [Saccharopolyspora subtropica]|uniref:DUF4237 domain-containing protein n=1 Tax=Saccharopolyspora thermophila TaxID=89367 RepID=A0A917N8A3_9PSEU|nr:glycohydrolase toxin TNT-related protein [Saccharopolyspora subtropica]GGI77309.1 hypothetical protein GCM10011581_12990 [Saccharopolyspora subtropica]